MPNLVIEAAGLTKQYGSRRGIVDVSFGVAEGEAFGFLGPNGAGKTTTIRLLLGFLRPTSGSALLFGHDAFADAARIHRERRLPGQRPGVPGRAHGGAAAGLPRRAARPPPPALAAARRAPGAGPHGPHPQAVSRGNRQKIGVVAAFMGHEPLLVLDEPTSGLDPLMQREFLALLAEAREAGRTVFLSSHNLVEVERACDRVAIIREGRIVEISNVGELLGSHWRSINLVLAHPPEASDFDLPNVEIAAMTGREVHLMVRGDINPLLARIAAHDVADIAITTPDVEDLFLRHVPGRRAAEEVPA